MRIITVVLVQTLNSTFFDGIEIIVEALKQGDATLDTEAVKAINHLEVQSQVAFRQMLQHPTIN